MCRGSPPRMRGGRPDRRTVRPGHRLTPAYAGRTTASLAQRPWSWAHPRVCGEDGEVHAAALAALGSPPRMRGGLGDLADRRRSERLTPAHAGRTGDRIARTTGSRAHPRACGEAPPGRLPTWGSRAHPRARGEDGLDWLDPVNVGGSPPRTRGGRRRTAVEVGQPGLTPAYAGTDPPVCVAAPQRTGSPPRMRGGHFLTSRYTPTRPILDSLLVATPLHDGPKSPPPRRDAPVLGA